MAQILDVLPAETAEESCVGKCERISAEAEKDSALSRWRWDHAAYRRRHPATDQQTFDGPFSAVSKPILQPKVIKHSFCCIFRNLLLIYNIWTLLQRWSSSSTFLCALPTFAQFFRRDFLDGVPFIFYFFNWDSNSCWKAFPHVPFFLEKIVVRSHTMWRGNIVGAKKSESFRKKHVGRDWRTLR